MLTGEYMESRYVFILCNHFPNQYLAHLFRAAEIDIPDIGNDIFLIVLEYIYCDSFENINVNNALDVFQAADRFNLDRLKAYSESIMVTSISIDTAATILLASDCYQASNLKKICFQFVLKNFDVISKTVGFEEMARSNIELRK